jgi:iron complex outermembrane recepter protein
MTLAGRILAALRIAAFVMSGMAAADVDTPNLLDLSIEELAEIRVTSVSKRAEPLADAPASIFVITGEDIRRSGVTSLPEALRLAPNLLVARSSSGGYSISARGFNNAAGNKVLALIDGRTIYSPLFSGVFWDAQDLLLEDVERIEVVSGPGGTLWGTNAVNAVINVITRSAETTVGGLVAASAGNSEASSAVRYGGEIGAAHYRAYGLYLDRDHTALASGAAVNDGGHKGQIGFRSDWQRDGDQLTIQGDAYSGEENQPAPGMFSINGISRLNPISISGLNLLTRWARSLGAGGNLALLGYYDRTERDVPGTFDDSLDVYNLQLQHSLRPAGAHAATWGAEYRYGKDRIVNEDFVGFLPGNTNRTWASLFAQDDIAVRDNLRFTIGARAERNDYTGTEFLPSARVAWKLASDHLVWAAASRTARAPSRIDRELYYPATGPPFLIQGGAGFRSEIANVYELGYRGQPSTRVTWSITAFQAKYDHLRTLELAPSRTFVEFANQMDGTTRGLEGWVTHQVTAGWRLSAGLATLNKDLQLKPGSAGLNGGPAAEGNDPHYSWQIRSAHVFADRWELDAMVRGVAALPSPSVPSYVAADVRLGWISRRDFDLSITAQNLFDNAHAEFQDPLTRSEFGRSVFLKIVARF